MTYNRREFSKMALLAAGATVAGGTGLATGAGRGGGEQLAALYSSSDATGLAEHVAKGEVSAMELLEEAIRRVELVNPAINAISQKHYDLARAAIGKGLPKGPFTGVPFLLKDLSVSLAGTVTTHGSRLHANDVAAQTSLLVQRYQRAGLVIFGKTNTPEYGLALTTENLFLGDCLNPWNPQYSTGGSSGGSAAAVAANILPVAAPFESRLTTVVYSASNRPGAPPSGRVAPACPSATWLRAVCETVPRCWMPPRAMSRAPPMASSVSRAPIWRRPGVNRVACAWR